MLYTCMVMIMIMHVLKSRHSVRKTFTYSDAALVIICFPSAILILHSEKPQMKISSLPNSPVWNRAYPLRNLHCQAVPQGLQNLQSTADQHNTGKIDISGQFVCSISLRHIEPSADRHVLQWSSQRLGCQGFNRWK